MRKMIVLIVAVLLCSVAKGQMVEPIKWSYFARKVSSSEAIVYIKATVEAGWHIYSTNQKEGGPVKTSFSFTPNQSYVLVGKIVEPVAVKKFEEVFGMDVFFFEKSVVFQQKIKLKAKETVVKGSVEFMACTNKQCLPPSEVEFSIPVR